MVNITKNSRMIRALQNFDFPNHYEHEVILSEENRLDYNRAYDWAIEKFGYPGTTWDFYLRENISHSHNSTKKIWLDIFGFHDEKMAAMFILRWF